MGSSSNSIFQQQKGCAKQKFHPCLRILPSRETVCSDAQTSRGRCLTETGRNRGTPASGRDEPDRGTKRRVLRPVRVSRCRGKALATRRVWPLGIASFGWDQRLCGHREIIHLAQRARNYQQPMRIRCHPLETLDEGNPLGRARMDQVREILPLHDADIFQSSYGVITQLERLLFDSGGTIPGSERNGKDSVLDYPREGSGAASGAASRRVRPARESRGAVLAPRSSAIRAER